MQEMAPQWKNIGPLIGFTKAQLDVWNMQSPINPMDSMRSVIGAWMERKNENVGNDRVIMSAWNWGIIGRWFRMKGERRL